MRNREPNDEDLQWIAGNAERQRFKIAVGNTTLAWSMVDSAMVDILAGAGQMHLRMASAIYFSMSNTESRFRVTDAAVRELQLANKDAAPLATAWRHLYERLKRIKGTRNKIIHGALSTKHSRNSITVKIAPPYNNMQIHSDHSRQDLGLSIGDVEAHVALVRKYFDMLQQLSAVWPVQSDSFPQQLVLLQKHLREMGLDF